MYLNQYLEEHKEFFNNKTKIALFKIGYLTSKVMENMTLDEKSVFSVNILKGMDYRYINRDYIIRNLMPKLTILIEEYNINNTLLLDISEIIVETELNELQDDDADPILYIHLGLTTSAKFEDFISLQDACKEYNKAESTLKTNIKNGKFKVGKDVKKFGNTWVFNVDALEREYKK